MGHGNSDRSFVTHAEHVEGGYSAASSGKQDKLAQAKKFQPLPFDACAISLQPWSIPVVAPDDGTIFELTNILPFLHKYGSVNPSTGKPLVAKDLVRLHFAKNEDGQYYDPVSFKVFNQHTHIVAIRTSGNVFTNETVQQLNIKVKFWNDLVDDTPFTRKDLITIQDPHNVEARDLSKLHHVKNNLVVSEKEREAYKGVKLDDEEVNLAATGSAAGILQKLRKDREAKESASNGSSSKVISSSVSADLDSNLASSSRPKVIPHNITSMSTGAAAASFTSSSLTPQTKTEHMLLGEEQLMYETIQKLPKGKEKGYVRITTNFGALNLELHCNKAPKTCHNFLTLCRRGYYTESILHRNIPGFMIQGGDPTGTGRGGESMWGKPFDDEIDEPGAFRHDERGTLSMANKGPGTNGSQWFITYRKTPHLDRKHTVFGRLVNDDDTVLSALESVPTAPGTDKPIRSIRILDVAIFADPYDTYQQNLARKLARQNMTSEELKAREEKRRRKENDRTTWLGTDLGGRKKDGIEEPSLGLTGSASGVGRYVSGSVGTAASAAGEKRAAPISASVQDVGAAGNGKKRKAGGGFGDFSSW